MKQRKLLSFCRIRYTLMRSVLLILVVWTCCPVLGQSIVVYDIVLSGGRVIDPETRLDGIRNIGIHANRIAAISVDPLKGKEILDVSGLVVAPGFIDLHVHGRGNVEQEYQLHDGLTTALELEWGIEHLGAWYESRTSNALINYGASACWPFERFRTFDGKEKEVRGLREAIQNGETRIETLFNTIGSTYEQELTPSQTDVMLANIRSSLDEGAIGIGVPIGYLPKTDPEEMYRVYELAGQLDALVFSHVRAPSIAAIQEVLTTSMLTDAPLHIVHLNSMSLGKIQFALDLIDAANAKGASITTEVYPYTAASTLLQSALFAPGWQERLGMQYGDLQWVATGERLTEETFAAYRAVGGTVIMHMMQPDWIEAGIAAPGVIVASDGMPYAPLAHPRTAGTFSRVLGKYVREDQVLDLMKAIEKMTLLPARYLEGIAPMMRYKGRIQVGMDADITIFNPETIIDKATFEQGPAFSEGVSYVLVNGVLILEQGKTVPGTFPGQPIYGKFKQ